MIITLTTKLILMLVRASRFTTVNGRGNTKQARRPYFIFNVVPSKKKKRKEKKSLGATKNSLGRVPKKIKIC